MDTDAAIEQLAEFTGRVRRLEALQQRGVATLQNIEYENLKLEVNQRRPIIVAIARVVGGDYAEAIEEGLDYANYSAVSPLDRLMGELVNAELISSIIGPAGPQLAATELRPWVWGAAAQLWDDGYHRQAVNAAAGAVFDTYLPDKLKLPKDTGNEELVAKAFKDRLLVIPGLEPGTDDERNTYQGAQHLGLACAKLVRNIRTHEGAVQSSPEDQSVLLEELAILSRFARLVQDATLAAS